MAEEKLGADIALAAVQAEVERLRDENQRLRAQTESVAAANAHAAELMVALEAARDLLAEQNAQLDVHNRFIRQTFGRYLTNEVVASLLDNPSGLELGGEKRRVSLLMADLRGFTSLSESLVPEQVVKILNHYLGTMVDVILQYHGTIDEFIGDAIFVIFGAPAQQEDHAQRAVACAVAMQLAMEEVNAYNQQEGLPTVAMGIGVHTGEVVVGNIGSERRAKYGVVGRHVNLTARIESYTVGSQVLISETTRQEVGASLSISQQLEIEAKGVDKPITLSEVRGINGIYNLFLPEREDNLQPLHEAIRLRYAVVEDKYLGDTLFSGQLVKLSAVSGEIHADHSVPLWSNLKIQLPDLSGARNSSSLYAKVTGYPTQERTRFTIHFTFVPPAIATFFQQQHRVP
jgi:adenylate cyclase